MEKVHSLHRRKHGSCSILTAMFEYQILSNMHSARVLIGHIPRMECQHVCCGWNSCSQNVLHPKLHHVQLRTYMEHYNARIAIECIENGHEAFTRIDNKCCPLPTIIWPEIHKSFHCMWEPWAPGPL